MALLVRSILKQKSKIRDQVLESNFWLNKALNMDARGVRAG